MDDFVQSITNFISHFKIHKMMKFINFMLYNCVFFKNVCVQFNLAD